MPVREHKFDEKFKILLAFKAKHGHVDVPPNYKDDPALYRWVEVQREKYAREIISIKHYTFLEGVGFDWEMKQPVEEEEPSKEAGGKEEENDATEQKPTLKERLFDTDTLNSRQQAYITNWNNRYKELVGK